MGKETRQKNVSHHATALEGPVVVDWCSEKQRKCFEYGPVGGGYGGGGPICASGGYASGKTVAFCYKAMFLSDAFPGNRGVIARKVCKDLKDTTMKTFFKYCPPQSYSQGRRADSEFELRFNNGSEILWLHMDTDDLESTIRGLEINWVFIDQAEQIDEEIFDHLMMRLGRWDKAQVPEGLIAEQGGIDEWKWKNPVTGRPLPPNYMMLACNPDPNLYHWLYRRFHAESMDYLMKKVPVIGDDHKPTGEMTSYHDMGYVMVEMSARENKFLPKQVLQEALSKDQSYIDRFVDGKWGGGEGSIHKVDALSEVEGNLDLLDYLRRTSLLHMTLDHGDAAPTACAWWATDGSGNIWCLGEYYMPNQLISYHRQEITQLTQDLFYGTYSMRLADPSIFVKTMQKHGGRWSVSDEYADCQNLPRETALFWQAADNNELGTRNRISEYLQVDADRVNPVTREKGSPRLFFLKKNDNYPQGSDNVLRELKSQRRQKIGTEMGKSVFSDERDENVPDHAYDCVRYFIASRPGVPRAISEKYGPRSFKAVMTRNKAFRQAGGFLQLSEEARRVRTR